MSEDLILKTEPEWDPDTEASEAAELADLYKDHIVKDELVVGPEVLQPCYVPYAIGDVDPVIKSELADEDGTNDEGSSLSLSESAVSRLTTHTEGTHDDSFGVRAEGAHTCGTRGERLPGKSALIEHIQSSHGPQTVYSCRVCSKQYTSNILFVNHEHTHTRKCTVVVHPIEICCKEPKSKYILINDKRVHSGQKLYECGTCNKQFTVKGNLKNNISIHTGHKPHKCETCNKQFAQHSHLIEHIRIHTRYKPYTCEICNKQFTRRSHLEDHNRIHTGLKPYICEICDKKFTYGSSLKRHIRIHTGHKPHKCETCNKQFSDRRCLKRHIGYKPYTRRENSRLGNQNKVNLNRLLNAVTVSDEFECGVFQSQLPGEILNKKENRVSEEWKYIGLPSENGALKQLMSSDESSTKQRKTILFLGHDSHYGQTIHKIAMNDPYLVCSVKEEVNSRVVYEEPDYSNLSQKKYQCDKCKQIFDQIIEFRQHMVGDHISPRTFDGKSNGEIKFLCTECGKNIKSQKKFVQHCMRHGDPDLECNQCHKVFATKFTLRAHYKIHSRKYSCIYCSKTYSKTGRLRNHAAKAHCIFICEHCDYKTNKKSDLKDHEKLHEPVDLDDSCQSEMITLHMPDDVQSVKDGDIRIEADSVIAKVMSNEIFGAKGKRRQYRKCNKVCDVCLKIFDRICDLKRHLIDHIVKGTLDKIPVSRHGTLNIQCEVCQSEMFTTVDRYKAHLREHAKLTMYKCTFCDKSFSDSSNFSKHKKTHGTTYLQCDLCSRKFHSKRMLIQHMEYHNKNKPIPCQFCNKFFHFESMLYKHIKSVHATNKFKCRFCCNYFKTLKEKWDHEWTIHNVRKMIVDCLMCGSKFRKYTELKKHCSLVHSVEIPPAKKLWTK